MEKRARTSQEIETTDGGGGTVENKKQDIVWDNISRVQNLVRQILESARSRVPSARLKSPLWFSSSQQRHLLFDILVRRGNVRLDDDRSNYTVCWKGKHTHTQSSWFSFTWKKKSRRVAIWRRTRAPWSSLTDRNDVTYVQDRLPHRERERAFTTAASLCKPGCMSHHHLSTWTRAQFELRVAQPKNNSAIFLPPLIFFSPFFYFQNVNLSSTFLYPTNPP